MNRLVVLFVLLAPMGVLAQGHDVKLDEASINLHDQAALQRGAAYFVNHCLSCHSAAYARYSRVGQDLDLTETQLKDNLIFTDKKVGETMTVAMAEEAAKDWFGKAPPDLSVIVRARGVDWLYTFLRSFYVDQTRPFGVNNTVFPQVGMPHILWEYQGWQKPVYHTVKVGDREEQVIEGLELAAPGLMDPEKYDRMIRDIVTFLAYLSEPAQLERTSMGVYVLLFLAVLFGLTYVVKREYWKDVH